MQFSEYKALLFDFDGVILDSMPVRDQGFREVLSDYPQEQVEALVEFHHRNGGLSRYVKLRHFFEKMRHEPVTEHKIQELSTDFSKIMRELLTDKSLLIADTCTYLQTLATGQCDTQLYIVSGSDQQELQFLCQKLGIDHYFQGIYGSPTAKVENVTQIIQKINLTVDQVALIGDAHNDFEAATANGIHFYGYNNPALRNYGQGYITSFMLMV